MTSCRAIGVAQTIPIKGDVEKNLEQHLRLIRVAADLHAGLLVFPELSLSGYELELAAELAFTERDSRLSPLIDAASSSSMTLVAGAPVRVGSRLHIGAFILSPDRTVGLYTKHHLGAFSPSAGCDGVVPPAEATVFDPGDRNPLLMLEECSAAVAVCADTGRPSHVQAAADRGAKIYLASMFVIPSELDLVTARLRGHASRHSMTVAFSNFGGPSGGLASGGRSAIWSDTGEPVVQLDASGAGVAVVIESESGRRGERVMAAV